MKKKTSIKSVADFKPQALITKGFLNKVNPSVSKIKDALKDERSSYFTIGDNLASIRDAFIKEFGNKKVSLPLFKSFIEDELSIQPSRASEYIKLAERPDVRKLQLQTSSLIELARLDRKVFKKFLSKNPESILKKKTWGEIKELVRKVNPDKRLRGKTKANKKIALVVQLEQTFKAVKDEYEQKKLETKVDSVLGEFSHWYMGKKLEKAA